MPLDNLSTKDCYHWYTDRVKDENERDYCSKCNSYLREEKYWGVLIELGELKANQEWTTEYLDLEDILASALRVPSITLRKVVLKSEPSYTHDMVVWFTTGAKDPILQATVSPSTNTRWVPTGEFFVAPEIPDNVIPLTPEQ